MLIGEYHSKISNKKRVAIPKKLRDELGEDLILTRGYEGSLVIVNLKMWEQLASGLTEGSFINKNIRDTSRFLIGSAVEMKPDSQGRVVVPESLHEYASLGEEVVFIGLIKWVEIWDKEQWNERVKYLENNSEQIANELLTASKHE